MAIARAQYKLGTEYIQLLRFSDRLKALIHDIRHVRANLNSIRSYLYTDTKRHMTANKASNGFLSEPAAPGKMHRKRDGVLTGMM